MKNRLLITILGFSFSFLTQGQNAPSLKILENTFRNINLKHLDSEEGKYFRTLNWIDYKRKAVEIDTLQAQIKNILMKIEDEKNPSVDSLLRKQLKNKEDELK